MALTKVTYSMIVDAPANVKDFGAVGDGVANDYVAIQAACDTGLPVVFPKGIYNFGTYAAPQNLTLTNDNQSIFLQGSEVRFIGKGAINVNANNVTIDLQGGVLSQYIGYAVVATQTIDGGNQIVVADASNLFLGQQIRSSWGGGGGSGGAGPYPLGLANDPNPRTIIGIVGNTVTLSSNMTPGDTIIPGVYVGDFSFGVFFQCYKDNLVVKNGAMERVTGYYYHSPNTGVTPITTGGNVYFQNMYFKSNGTDQFLLQQGQKLYIQNCRAEQQWDIAKSGIFVADEGSIYISNSDLKLGNFDSSITIWNIKDASINSGEIIISDSNISGRTRFPAEIPGTMAQNNLHAIETRFEGTFNRVRVSNSRFADYSRYFISSTVIARSLATTIEAVSVDNCLIDGSFAYFLHTGSGKGIFCPNVRVSNTSFYQNKPFIFFQASVTSSASSTFIPNFDNCYFSFATNMATYAEFGSPAVVSDSTFNMNGIAYTHRAGIAEIDNCLFTNNPQITIRPAFDVGFYGELSRIVIDSPDFPQNPAAVFTALGGTSLSGAKIASARSIDGSVFYDVFKAGSTIRARGTFLRYTANVYVLRGDDYYIPQGSNISDMNDGTLQRVSFGLATTLASAAPSGSTSIVVADATGVTAGDRVNILGDDGLVGTMVVDGAYVSGTTIPLTAATSRNAANGNKVNFFRVVAL